MRVTVPVVAVLLLALALPGAAHAAVSDGGGDGIGGLIGEAFSGALDRFMANSPAPVVGNFLLRAIGWVANRFAESQANFAESNPITELDRRMITQNGGVVAGYMAFSGIVAAWVSLVAVYNGIRCMVSVGRSALGETISAVGPGMIVPVLLAVNGLPLMDWVIQVANAFSRAIYTGTSGNPIADTLRAGAAAGGGEGDTNAAMGAYVLSLGAAFFVLALSRLAIHGVAAMCAITFVPAVLCATTAPTQWVTKVWLTFAAGSFLGHILQAAAIRAGGGMMASAFSGQQGQVGTPDQLSSMMAGISTMMFAAVIPGLVGLGTAAHSFGIGALAGRLVSRRMPQRTKEVDPPQVEQERPDKADAQEVVRGQMMPPRRAPVRPSAAPVVIVMEPVEERPALPAPRQGE